MSGERQGSSLFSLLQMVIFLAWISVFAWLLHDGGDGPLLGRFLRPQYWWLVQLATAVLICFAASLTIRPAPHHPTGTTSGIVQVAFLVVPLLYLPLAVSSELSSEAVQKRSLQAGRRATYPSRVKASAAADKPAANPSRNPSLVNLVSDPESYEGQSVTLIGKVHHDKRLSGSTFFCYRMVMTCCAADATPVGIIVEHATARTLKKGHWVTIEGRVSSTTFEGESYPMISADRVEQTKAPRNLFLVGE